MGIASLLSLDVPRGGSGHSPARVFLAAVAVLALVTAVDALTPYEFGFAAFYVIPVLIATWGVGTARGLGFALLSACCWYCVDLTSGRPLTHEFYRFWDSFNHLLSYSLIAVLTGRLKTAFQQVHELHGDLEQTLKNVRELEGLLPVCAWCKKIRDDAGYWQELDAYLEPRTKATFSHGICPDCAAKMSAAKRDPAPGGNAEGERP
jgi:hypothetical protein